MTLPSIEKIQRYVATHFSLSGNLKTVLKRLKAEKPGGRGQPLSVARPASVHPAFGFQEERTDQWRSSQIRSHQP